ncbi:MAG: hypothetical protein ACRDZS_03025, partial [Acidimicrobiales bacterium]
VPQVSEFWRNAILGALILAAVIADVVVGRRFQRRWSAEARPHTKVDSSTGAPDTTKVPALTAPEQGGEATDA